ncbi:MAG: amidohydrolase [Verrucomicrobia subdivision 3 bacterium]|nr:amidohydrolase [Limisphaerales bacterium]
MTRREAILTGAAALTGCATLSPNHTGHIDAHSHIWTDEVNRFPLAPGKTVADLKPRTFTPETLIALGDTENVTRHVLISHGTYHGYNNDYYIHAAKKSPGVFAIVGAMDPALNHIPTRMIANRKLGITGYRILPKNNTDWLQAAPMQTMWRTGATERIAMCPLIDPKFIAGLGPMCERFPDTPVVIDHCARIDTQHETELTQLCALAKHKNVHVKISAFYAFGAKKPPYDEQIPKVKRLFEVYGPQRLMWASDCPYQLGGENTYAASIALVRDKLDFVTAEDKRWLLRRTAEKVFFS